MDKKKLNLAIAFCIAAVFYIVAVTAHFDDSAVFGAASYVFGGVFLSLIFLLLTNSLPDWVAAMGACAVLILTDNLFVKFGVFERSVFTTAGLFSAFSSATIWLIIMVFALSAGIGKSGLLNRIAVRVLAMFPPTYGGAVLAMMLTGTILSPLIPSVNAKVNILIPFATATTEELKLAPRSKGAVGLFSACYLPAYVGGNAFLTGSVYASVICGFVTSYAASLGAEGATFTFTSWFVAASVWLAVLLIGVFVFAYFVCRPAEKVEFSSDYYSKRYRGNYHDGHHPVQ